MLNQICKLFLDSYSNKNVMDVSYWEYFTAWM